MLFGVELAAGVLKERFERALFQLDVVLVLTHLLDSQLLQGVHIQKLVIMRESQELFLLFLSQVGIDLLYTLLPDFISHS